MCKHYIFKLEQGDRHYVNSPENNNCVLCLSEYNGPMTQVEVAKYLGVSKMRICQIERKAIKKMKKKINMLYW